MINLHTEIIGLPIGVNIPGWESRVSMLLGYYRQGKIGSLQYYAAPSYDPHFSHSNVSKLMKRLSDVKGEQSYPLDVVVHLAHNSHNFNPTNGMNHQNRECIKAACDAAMILGSDKIIFHPGHYIGKFTEERKDRVRRVFDYISRRLPASTNFLVENMPVTKDEHYLFSRMNEDQDHNFIEDLRRQYRFSTCLDYTHLSVAALHPLTGDDWGVPNILNIADGVGQGNYRIPNGASLTVELFPTVFNAWANTFLLTKSPSVMHVTGCSHGDTSDRKQKLTIFNILHIAHATAYSLGCKEKGQRVPLILELPVDQWNEQYDMHNLAVAAAGVAMGSEDSMAFIAKYFRDGVEQLLNLR